MAKITCHKENEGIVGILLLSFLNVGDKTAPQCQQWENVLGHQNLFSI